MIHEVQPDLFTVRRSIPVEHVDITARKHGGNINSVRANALVNKNAQNARIVELLKESGPMTSKEIAASFGVPLHTISGRFKWLRDKGWIVLTGASRENSAEHRWSGK